MGLGPLDEKSATIGDGLIPNSVFTWVMKAIGDLVFIKGITQFKYFLFTNAVCYVSYVN